MPQTNGAGASFHLLKAYAEIARMVRENPGLTGSEMAALPGNSRECVGSLRFHFKKSGQATLCSSQPVCTGEPEPLRKHPRALRLPWTLSLNR